MSNSGLILNRKHINLNKNSLMLSSIVNFLSKEDYNKFIELIQFRFIKESKKRNNNTYSETEIYFNLMNYKKQN